MEDNSAPAYLEMHPQWVDNGSIEGMYTLPAPIIAGDHFRSRVGFILPQNPPSAGEVDFAPYVGATRIRLRVDATGTSAQDWACWIAPTVGA